MQLRIGVKTVPTQDHGIKDARMAGMTMTIVRNTTQEVENMLKDIKLAGEKAAVSKNLKNFS